MTYEEAKQQNDAAWRALYHADISDKPAAFSAAEKAAAEFLPLKRKRYQGKGA